MKALHLEMVKMVHFSYVYFTTEEVGMEGETAEKDCEKERSQTDFPPKRREE